MGEGVGGTQTLPGQGGRLLLFLWNHFPARRRTGNNRKSFYAERFLQEVYAVCRRYPHPPKIYNPKMYR